MPENARTLFCRWRRFGRAGVLLDAGKILYIDPIAIEPGAPKADIVLLTHGHADHFSPDDVAKVASAQTVVAGPAACVGLFRLNQLPFEAGESKTILGVSVMATPAYCPDDARHPKEAGGLGYLIEIGGARIFCAGDTAVVPELRGLTAEAGFLPVAEDLMSAQTAAALARDMGLRMAALTHAEPGSALEKDFIGLAEKDGIAAWLPEPAFAAA